MFEFIKGIIFMFKEAKKIKSILENAASCYDKMKNEDGDMFAEHVAHSIRACLENKLYEIKDYHDLFLDVGYSAFMGELPEYNDFIQLNELALSINSQKDDLYIVL